MSGPLGLKSTWVKRRSLTAMSGRGELGRARDYMLSTCIFWDLDARGYSCAGTKMA